MIQAKRKSRKHTKRSKRAVVRRVPTIPTQTAERMVEMVKEAIQAPEIVEVAKVQVRKLVDEHNGQVLNKMSEISAIHGLVSGMIRYTRDPFRVEWVYDPVALLKKVKKYGRWAEDCDSYAVLTATLLASIGHQVRITLVGFTNNPNQFSHVFCESHIKNVGWLIVDPSLRHKVVPMATKIKTFKFYPL
jgi:hypothetical protein